MIMFSQLFQVTGSLVFPNQTPPQVALGMNPQGVIAVLGCTLIEDRARCLDQAPEAHHCG